MENGNTVERAFQIAPEAASIDEIKAQLRKATVVSTPILAAVNSDRS